MMQRFQPSPQSGSAFFIILLAIMMFAGLSYALMQGSRTGASTLSDDQARIAAQEIIAIGDSVQKAVQAMRLRGVPEAGFDFYTPVYVRLSGAIITSTNTNCTTNACKVYNIEGGKVAPTVAPEAARIDQSAMSTGHFTSGHVAFRSVVVANVGTSASELLFKMNFVNRDVCKKINDILGVTNPSGEPPVDAEDNYMNYRGTLGSFPEASPPGLDSAPEISGKTAFCVYEGGFYHYYAVLLTR